MFIDALLMDSVSYGVAGGPEWLTTVVPTRRGRESRNQERTRPKYNYILPYNIIDPNKYILVINAVNAAAGRAHYFRFFDRMDYLLTNQVIGTATGVPGETMQLVKTYPWGTGTATRIITKPVDSTIDYGRGEEILGAAPAFVIKANGTPIAFTLGYTTGIATFTTTAGFSITASGWFDVPVRFASDKLMFSLNDRNFHSTDIELIEVWDENE